MCKSLPSAQAVAGGAGALGLARNQFEQFRQFLHLDLDKLDGREREWWSKGPTHVLRLAGTLAYLGWAWIGGPEPERIEALYVRNAVRLWTHYYWPHARAALRLVGQSDKHADARRVLRWLEAGGMDEISIKDVRRDALGQKLNAEIYARVDRASRTSRLAA